MSKVIGDRLPEEILEAFDGTDLAEKIGPAHLLVTADADGTPRPCMLSAGEILAADDRHLRFALWPGTTTAKNLGDGQRVLFCFVALGVVYYVKGPSRPIGKGPASGLARFELEVETVESDIHAGMPVTGPITFDVQGDRSEVAASWQRQIADLAEV